MNKRILLREEIYCLMPYYLKSCDKINYPSMLCILTTLVNQQNRYLSYIMRNITLFRNVIYKMKNILLLIEAFKLIFNIVTAVYNFNKYNLLKIRIFYSKVLLKSIFVHYITFFIVFVLKSCRLISSIIINLFIL